MSRSQVTSTVGQNTGGAVAPFVAGKNKIINGDFGIWQRGTSFSTPQAAYTSDRWCGGYFNGAITYTFSQVAFDYGASPASDKLPITGQTGTYFARSSIASASATFAETYEQKIEDVHTFAGQTINISFWAKSDSTRTQTLEIFQYFGSGGSSISGGTVSTFSTTTSWQRFSYSTSIPSIVGKTLGAGHSLNLYIAQAVASGSILDVWGVQIEAGSVATPFTTATGNPQGELAACQRYYYRTSQNTAYTTFTGSTAATSTTNAYNLPIWLPVQMRVAPTSVDFSTLRVTDGYVAANNVSNVTIDGNSANIVNVDITSSSLTVGRPVALQSNGTSGYLGFSAEL